MKKKWPPREQTISPLRRQSQLRHATCFRRRCGATMAEAYGRTAAHVWCHSTCLQGFVVLRTSQVEWRSINTTLTTETGRRDDRVDYVDFAIVWSDDFLMDLIPTSTYVFLVPQGSIQCPALRCLTRWWLGGGDHGSLLQVGKLQVEPMILPTFYRWFLYIPSISPIRATEKDSLRVGGWNLQ